jgi:site-specific recombinase XerD
MHIKLFPLFSNWLEIQSYMPNTKNTYLQVVGKFLFYLDSFDIARLKDVSNDLLIQFITKRGPKLYAQANINLRLSALYLFYAWAHANRYCQTNPVIEHKKTKLNTKHFPKKILESDDGVQDDIIILTPKELEALLNTKGKDSFTTARNRFVIDLILAGALYAEEVIGLLAKDINLKKGYITVCNKKRGRRVQMNSQVSKSCQKWLIIRASTLCTIKLPFLFFTDKAKPITKRELHRIISKCMIEAGINKEHLGPEVLRQTAISNMLSSGKTIEEVQTITGIKTLKNIQKYQRAVSD